MPENKDRAQLYSKIATVTAAVSRIPKNGKNDFHKYSYATESDITDGLRELLNANGLAFLPPSVLEYERSETAKRDGSRGDDLTRVKMQFEIACTDSGEVYTSQFWGEGQDGGDKGFYKAYTGAVKYFLMKTFLIATGDDPEHAQQEASFTKSANRANMSTPQQGGHAPSQNGNAISEKQIKMLFAIWNKGGFDGDLKAWIQESYGKPIDDLTKKEASAAIEALQPKEAA